MAREIKYAKGQSLLEKIHSLDATLESFSRRLSKTVVGVMPPIPICAYVREPNSCGDLLQFMFPMRGVIKKGCLFVNEIEGKDAITFAAEINGLKDSSGKLLTTRSQMSVVDIDLRVVPGDRVRVVTFNPQRVKGVWVALAFYPDMGEMEKEAFLIEGLKRLTEE